MNTFVEICMAEGRPDDIISGNEIARRLPWLVSTPDGGCYLADPDDFLVDVGALGNDSDDAYTRETILCAREEDSRANRRFAGWQRTHQLVNA